MRPMRMVGLGSIAAVALAASLSVSVSALPAQARPVPPGPGPGGYPTKALIPSPGNKATADPPRMTAAGHQKMSMASAGPDLTQQLATARLATAKYATNLSRAKADGYQIITKMMPNMGFHFMNPKVQGFSIRKPQILVYEHHGSQWQLGALEWVFGKMPKNPPLPNATFGSFGRLPLPGRHLHPGPEPEDVPEAGPAHRGQVHLLASGPGHDARLGLVPQLSRPVLQHEPAGCSVQPRLTSSRRAGRA